MPRLIATHEVDDVAHWLASPKRAEAMRYDGVRPETIAVYYIES